MEHELYIYADILFLKNSMMNILTLYLTAALINIGKKHKRFIMASVLGAVYQLIILKLCINVPLWLYGALAGTGGFLMIKVAYSCIGGITTFKMYCTFIFTAFMLNGVLEVLNDAAGVAFIIIASLFCIIPGLMPVCFIKRSVPDGGRVYDVKIFYRDKEYRCRAFYDTGNHLVNPADMQAAAVMEENAFVNFTGITKFNEEVLLNNRTCIMPYTSAGCMNGIIYGIIADKMEIQSGRSIKCIENIPVGCVKGLISKDKDYEMLLPCRLYI